MKSNEVENRRDNLFEITISQDVFINTIELYVPLLTLFYHQPISLTLLLLSSISPSVLNTEGF